MTTDGRNNPQWTTDAAAATVLSAVHIRAIETERALVGLLGLDPDLPPGCARRLKSVLAKLHAANQSLDGIRLSVQKRRDAGEAAWRSEQQDAQKQIRG